MIHARIAPRRGKTIGRKEAIAEKRQPRYAKGIQHQLTLFRTLEVKTDEISWRLQVLPREATQAAMFGDDVPYPVCRTQ